MAKAKEVKRSACGMEQYDTRDLIVTEDIMKKAKELAQLISTSAEVDYYKRAEKQINNNEHVQSLIKQIKKKQKEAVAFEKTFKNEEMVKKIEAEIEALQDELDSIPIVSEFQQSQSDLNYLLQLTLGIVRDTVAQKIELDQSQPEEETPSIQ
ncbi:YlbF family regulator [Paenibacillus senegalensis]|uniref:YlbF family regulator n=1 Tax=Paenibacillus senegalensis TaxID=1465766 RepID=UPI000287BEA6|nr:YlbF family regulator [Paenibacillus senegalensis]